MTKISFEFDCIFYCVSDLDRAIDGVRFELVPTRQPACSQGVATRA